MGEALASGATDNPDSVVIRTKPFAAMARAAGTAPALSVVALVIATATLLTMAAANDIANARLYSSHGLNSVEAIRWAVSVRLAAAAVALLLAVLAGVRYARGLPATRYTFSADAEEATESTEGTEAPGWVTMLVGSGVVLSVLALVLNTIALLVALHLHESPNFGLAPG
jgi:hypothetical protein